MQAVDRKADKKGDAGKPRRRWPRALAGLSRAIGLMTLTAGFGIGLGFAWFVGRIPTEEVSIERNADGIVVLTGGASRITDAIELLAAGKGKRLLISGVHYSTTRSEIARLVPAYERLFKCCIDLDRSAVNTVGNAVETRRWAREREFRSLIVVTSSYHVPRSMAELSRQLPDVTLISYPVVTERLRVGSWWTSPPALRLLFTEYVKYVVAQVRMRIGPSELATGLAGGVDERKG